MEAFFPSWFSKWIRLDAVMAAGIFLAAFIVFFRSPVTYVTDSRYSLLLSQALVSKGTFHLDGYGIPITMHHSGKSYRDRDVYQIEVAHDHAYYLFPPGSSILSVPFVVVGGWFGESVLKPDGTFNQAGEDELQEWIAPFLMAILAAVFYGVGRQLLPVSWSTVLALGGVLGTQVWSTASRALWSHTWTLLFLGVLIYMLLAHEMGRRKLRPVLLGTLLSWMYFVRPTSSIAIIGVTVYVLVFYRSAFIPMALTGAAWLGGFIAYSWHNFGTLVPSYYAAARLGGSTFREALVGNLFSPSRGFFIFVPVAFFVLYLLIAHWRSCGHRRLIWLSLAVCVGHVLAVSGAYPWYAGWCYGARYMTELVPWFVLLGGIALEARLRDGQGGAASRRPFSWRITWAAGATLMALSVWMNERGAYSRAASLWNGHPVNIDADSTRVWSWSYPQWLAGIVRAPLPPLPAAFPPLSAERVTCIGEKNKELVLEGWSIDGDEGYWWNDGRYTTLIFAANDSSARHLRLAFRPYLHPPEATRQRLRILLNGRELASLVDDDPQVREFSFPVPKDVLGAKNFLTIELPDSVAPEAVGDGRDVRRLGIALYWIELDATDGAPDAPGATGK